MKTKFYMKFNTDPSIFQNDRKILIGLHCVLKQITSQFSYARTHVRHAIRIYLWCKQLFTRHPIPLLPVLYASCHGRLQRKRKRYAFNLTKETHMDGSSNNWQTDSNRVFAGDRQAVVDQTRRLHAADALSADRNKDPANHCQIWEWQSGKRSWNRYGLNWCLAKQSQSETEYHGALRLHELSVCLCGRLEYFRRAYMYQSRWPRSVKGAVFKIQLFRIFPSEYSIVIRQFHKNWAVSEVDEGTPLNLVRDIWSEMHVDRYPWVVRISLHDID